LGTSVSPWYSSTGSLRPFSTYVTQGSLCRFRLTISQYTNAWYTSYLPILSNKSFDNTAKNYNVTRILTPDNTFDEASYKTYSPLFLPAAFAVSYGLSFASITAIVMHIFLYYRKQIGVQARRSMSEQPDIHARLMSVYKEVPEWWYGIIFGAFFMIPLFGNAFRSCLASQSPCSSLVLSSTKCGRRSSPSGPSLSPS